jgi:SAM-dependent methyltransferase
MLFEVASDKALPNKGGPGLSDTGERMIPPAEGELSIVFERHRFAYLFAGKLAPGKSVLDIGCGTGHGTAALGESARRVVGKDKGEEAIAFCRASSSRPNIECRLADAASLELAESFDLVVSFQLIEHLPDPEDFVRRLKRVTAPGGTILISTPRSLVGLGGTPDNPFLISETTYAEFSALMERCFSSFPVLGIGYGSRNPLREFIVRSPLYRLGRLLTRRSNLKRVAAKAIGMTDLRILVGDISKDAIDLLAVCTNS